MRKALIFLLFGIPLWAQEDRPIRYHDYDPSNPCSAITGYWNNWVSGRTWQCVAATKTANAGTWRLVSQAIPLVDPTAASTYDFPAQTPTVTLTGTVPASITLVPCPVGLAGTDTQHYVYLSGGTGTAEAVLITGGTCTSGATTGTILFTPANSHSGAWTIRSASGGIKEAVNHLALTGGVVFVDQVSVNVYQTIVIGNGSVSAASTSNNVTLRGNGAGSTPSETTTPSIASRLLWLGPTAGTMLDIEGPFNGANIHDLYFECNRTGGAGGTGLLNNHVFNSQFSNLTFNGCSGWAIKQLAYSNPTGVVIGANNDVWTNIEIYADTVTTASCLLGGAATDTGAPHLDVAKNIFQNFNCGAGTAGTAFEARFMDSSIFLNFNVTSGNKGILVTQVLSNTFTFPQALSCYQCNFTATTVIDDSSWTTGLLGMLFLAYNNDADLSPEPLGTRGWAAGLGTNMRIFGNWKYTPANYQSIVSSTAIANTTAETAFSKSYTIPQIQLVRDGLTIRVTASGHYSTTGMPLLSLIVRIGGTGVDGNIIGGALFTAPYNASGVGWSATTDVVIRATGLSGSLQPSYSNFGLGGTFATASSFTGLFTMDTLTDKGIYVTATWGSASPSNTITMDSLHVDLLHPGTVN